MMIQTHHQFDSHHSDGHRHDTIAWIQHRITIKMMIDKIQFKSIQLI